MQTYQDDLTIEMARLTREAHERAVRRIAAAQLGEAFRDLPRFRKEAP